MSVRGGAALGLLSLGLLSPGLLSPGLLSLALAAGCTQTTAARISVTLVAVDANDLVTDAGVDSADGGGGALCCSVPRVLTGLEKFDPNESTPYHNVMVHGTPQQQAYATCDQLSAWPEPLRPTDNPPTQAEIDRYMAQFIAGPDVAIVTSCSDPAEAGASYGHWQCGGDAGQAAGCMSNGLSCGVGSACWFDPGGTNGYGCTGTVVNCN